jgi:hypothetical protein
MDWACDRQNVSNEKIIHTYIPLILMGKYLENTQFEDRKVDGRIILR